MFEFLFPDFLYLCRSLTIKKSLANNWKYIWYCESKGQKGAETHYGHTKIALEEDSDAIKCLIALGMRKMGGTSRLFSLDQSNEQEFGLNLEYLLFLSSACTNCYNIFLC